MIQFDEEDDDPYTIIIVSLDGEVQQCGHYAFSLESFENWLSAREFPENVETAVALVDEFDKLTKKQAHESTQRIMDELKREQEGSYEERYARLKSQGLDDRTIHTRLFPEEYDFMYDDHVDVTLRGQGINPMSQEYINETNARRTAGGFTSFSDGSNEETMQWCRNKHAVNIKEKPYKLPSSYSERYARLVKQGYDNAAIHRRLFPEEYDYMYDTPEEAKLRAEGVNPKNQGYQDYVNKRRAAGGFSPFDIGHGEEAMDWCLAQRKKQESDQ